MQIYFHFEVATLPVCTKYISSRLQLYFLYFMLSLQYVISVSVLPTILLLSFYVTSFLMNLLHLAGGQSQLQLVMKSHLTDFKQTNRGSSSTATKAHSHKLMLLPALFVTNGCSSNCQLFSDVHLGDNSSAPREVSGQSEMSATCNLSLI